MIRIQKIDEEKKIVWGEVYAPNVVDSHGDLMLAADIELLAHRFMKLASEQQAIDTMHNNEANGAYPVESFIARANDPDGYTEGSWVLGTKVEDDEIWKAVKCGDLNGYSFEALVTKENVVAELDILVQNVGETAECDGHTHLFFAEIDDSGKVVKGHTDVVNGHSHCISRGTATDKAAGHQHRFFV